MSELFPFPSFHEILRIHEHTCARSYNDRDTETDMKFYCVRVWRLILRATGTAELIINLLIKMYCVTSYINVA